MNIDLLIQQIINGLAIGMVYGLIAIGYSIVYGILRFVNFGHGAVYTLGTYIAFYVWMYFLNYFSNWPSFILGTLVSMLITGFIGILIERVAYKPARGKSRLTAFMSSVGISFFITYGMEFLVGPAPRTTPNLFENLKFHIGNSILTGMQIFILGIAVLLVLILQIIINKTQVGRAIRACSEDMEAASLMGVNVDKTISITFGIGSSLAAVAGILVGVYYRAIYPTMGWAAGLKGFICAVTGGIGSVPGALLGGVLVGFAENLGAAFISSGYRDAIAYIILIFIMIFRPTGIIAKEMRSSL